MEILMSHQGLPPVEVKILDERLKDWGLPKHQSAMAAAIDLFACLDKPVTLFPREPARLISTGFSMLIGDPRIAALIVPRSGLGHKQGLVLGNTVGLIDPDYTGPVMVSAWNRTDDDVTSIVINPGDRFAQMLFVPVLHPRFEIVAEFSKATERDVGSFGSTGTT
jgi:dUTP pyrophosphatase